MPVPLREINYLEFVLLVNEENNDLYVLAWMGISNLLSSTWRERQSLDVALHDWENVGVEDSESLLAWGSLCSGRRWLRKHSTGLGATCTYPSWVSLETAVPGNLHGSFWLSECRGARHSPVLYSLLNASLLESFTSDVFLVCTLWIFSTAASINTSAYKMWKSSEKRIN